MSQFDVEALVVGGLIVVVAIAVAVWLRWQLEHPERKKKPAR